ncbi:hypothetical protein CEXT_300251 [Caerostris extrusa]|uniref:Uncharacterized protein n=1 Tax=Caerostris extrusa TaxID=172846 RepID=A0AAV4VWG0_CAEEX|nr:hypothetical protein CEXT_300251 [Caerostris extrusa]
MLSGTQSEMIYHASPAPEAVHWRGIIVTRFLIDGEGMLEDTGKTHRPRTIWRREEYQRALNSSARNVG